MTAQDKDDMRVADITDEEYIERFQQYLSAIRGIARMTALELGNEVGLTRQTISALENGKQKMSKVQYLALRSVFNIRAVQHPEIAGAIVALVDRPIEEVSGHDVVEEMLGDDAKEKTEEALEAYGEDIAAELLAGTEKRKNEKLSRGVSAAITAASATTGFIAAGLVSGVIPEWIESMRK